MAGYSSISTGGIPFSLSPLCELISHKSANSALYFFISLPRKMGRLFYAKFASQKQAMIYGYIRVSSDKQTVENQRYEINEFAHGKEFIVDRWIEEVISGTKSIEERSLGKLIKKMKGGDILICTELSRLGRNLLMIMSILNHCMEKDIRIWTIKDNFRLGDDINSKVLAFAFGLAAEIERNLISQRTKEALARKKAEGVVLGRPKGSKSSRKKLTGKEEKIKELLEAGVSYNAIARYLKVHRLTVSAFVKENKLGR
jgi:DNA invertase Pin-like site-specific DNA recombinase